MSKAAETILAAARECFFQHGYNASNVTLIGRYAGISRATIYKNFSSKENLFRAIVQKHINDNRPTIESYGLSTHNFWQETEQLVAGRCQGIFDEISSNIIRGELIQAGKTHCQDMLQQEKKQVQQAIIARLTREISKGEVSLTRTNISVESFAKVIEALPIGIAFSSLDDNSNEIIRTMFAIFQASSTAGV